MLISMYFLIFLQIYKMKIKSFECPKSKLATQCFFSIYQNNTQTFRRLGAETINQAYYIEDCRISNLIFHKKELTAGLYNDFACSECKNGMNRDSLDGVLTRQLRFCNFGFILAYHVNFMFLQKLQSVKKFIKALMCMRASTRARNVAGWPGHTLCKQLQNSS